MSIEARLSEIGGHRHRQAEIRTLLAGPCATKPMAGQTLHDEDFLATTGRIIRRHACIERKLRPSLQWIGATSEACNRLGPLLRPTLERSGCSQTR